MVLKIKWKSQGFCSEGSWINSLKNIQIFFKQFHSICSEGPSKYFWKISDYCCEGP